jgi:hypothetical protein
MISPKLPSFFKPYFWDYDFGKLGWPDDGGLIISRILSSGDWRAISWVRKQMGDEPLRDWIASCKGRGLDRRQLRFWELVLDIDHKIVNTWIKEREGLVWEERTNR